MSKEQDKKVLESALTHRSIGINEGIFILTISKSELNKPDFNKLCLYGDAFPSRYSSHLSMIPVGAVLPQMFLGKNVIMEHKIDNGKEPMVDLFTQFAFLIHDEGHKDVRSMYDQLFSTTREGSYSETYDKMKTSLRHHMLNEKRNVNYPNEEEMLNTEQEDEETKRYLKENSDKLTIMVFTHSASVRLQENDPKRLNFGNPESQVHYIPLANNLVAKFDGYTTNKSCNVSFSDKITSAIKRELFTLTQFFVGFEKQSGGGIGNYIKNVNLLFNGQLKAIICRNEDDVETYTVGALKLFMSRNLEIEEINTKSVILTDENYEETIRKKILFHLIQLIDVESCFNARNLTKKEIVDGKPVMVFSEPYTNPFHEIVSAMYENISWLTHILTACTFYNKIKTFNPCESCDQKTCAINAPASLFFIRTNRLMIKKERSSAICCFNTSNNYNRTGPFGNLRSSEKNQTTTELNNTVIWEKHYRDLYTSLKDSYTFDLSSFESDSPATEHDIDERTEKIMEYIGFQIDNIKESCQQFCQQLQDIPETIQKVEKVEAEIRNVYRQISYYDKGFMGICVSECLMYILRSVLLYEQSPFRSKDVNDIFLRVQALFLDNKSGFAVTRYTAVKNSIPKVAVKSYTSDDIPVDIQSKLIENYTFPELYTQISFKSKIYLFGRFNEKKGNGGRKPNAMLQNMSPIRKGGGMTAMSMNNSFLQFKNFCSKMVCKTLKVEENDYCREIVNDIKDSRLAKYADIFNYVTQYVVEDWASFIQLIGVTQMMNFLNFEPSYGKVSFTTFNTLKYDEKTKTYTFHSSLEGEEFDSNETFYAIKCHVLEFVADIQGKNIVFKKIAGKILDQHNELINGFSKSRNQPGVPLYYLNIGEKNNRFKENVTDNMMNSFLNTEQYKLENEAGYTTYIFSHRKQFYDAVFESTFADQGRYIENRYSTDVLEEMMSSFDERYTIESFSNPNVREFVKLVLREYLNPDQSLVKRTMSRIKELYMKVQMRKRLKRPRDDDVEEGEDGGEDMTAMTNPNLTQEDEEEDAENQFLNKRVKF